MCVSFDLPQRRRTFPKVRLSHPVSTTETECFCMRAQDQVFTHTGPLSDKRPISLLIDDNNTIKTSRSKERLHCSGKTMRWLPSVPPQAVDRKMRRPRSSFSSIL